MRDYTQYSSGLIGMNLTSCHRGRYEDPEVQELGEKWRMDLRINEGRSAIQSVFCPTVDLQAHL